MHTRKVPLSDDVDLSVIARGTPGFSGADLANLVNEAALWAARQNRKFVTMADFEMSKDKVLMGVERKSMILSDEEKKNTAYHEAGHALVAAMTPGADPLHKVTIIPRGMALGVTMQLPIDDKHTYTKEFLESQLAVLMGGRAAEEIFLNHITTGAGNDIERATEIARQMVCEWGMSALGPLTFGKKEERSSWAAKSRSIATIPRTRRSRSTAKFAASSTTATRARATFSRPIATLSSASRRRCSIAKFSTRPN